MGYGDEIIATGLARAVKGTEKRAAFGDGRKILWGPWCEPMFRNNPNIAPPGSEKDRDLEWIKHYKGSRLYNKQSDDKAKWVWNYNFKVVPGEFYWSDSERRAIDSLGRTTRDFVVIEPNLPWQKGCAPNKDWGEEKYVELSRRLQAEGIRVVQFTHDNTRRRLPGAMTMQFATFREAIAALSLASLYVGPEGGMHHAAAAVGIRAVVLMGGFIPPEVVGYEDHINFTDGAKACGSIYACRHCREVMDGIPVDRVFEAAKAQLA